MQVKWVKNTQNQDWFDLLKLNVYSPYFNNIFGVYVIWYTTSSGGKVIKIGTGNIGEKLRIEKTNPEILRFSNFGQLKVTWSIISPMTISGVLAYLSDEYNPVLGETVPPGISRIAVNLIE